MDRIRNNNWMRGIGMMAGKRPLKRRDE